MRIQSSTEEDATLPAAIRRGYLCGYWLSIHITAGLDLRAIMTTATAAKSIRAQERSPTSVAGRQFKPKRSASNVNHFTRGSCKCRVLRGPVCLGGMARQARRPSPMWLLVDLRRTTGAYTQKGTQ